MSDEDRRCVCHDGCIVPLIARKQADGMWRLYCISEVRGMGDASHDCLALEDEFSDIIPLNSFSGTAYAGLKKAGNWGLLELKDNGEARCEWKRIEDFRHKTLASALKVRGIAKDDYWEW